MWAWSCRPALPHTPTVNYCTKSTFPVHTRTCRSDINIPHTRTAAAAHTTTTTQYSAYIETTFRNQFVWLQMIFVRKLPYALKNPRIFFRYPPALHIFFSSRPYFSTHLLVHGRQMECGAKKSPLFSWKTENCGWIYKLSFKLWMPFVSKKATTNTRRYSINESPNHQKKKRVHEVVVAICIVHMRTHYKTYKSKPHNWDSIYYCEFDVLMRPQSIPMTYGLREYIYLFDVCVFACKWKLWLIP